MPGGNPLAVASVLCAGAPWRDGRQGTRPGLRSAVLRRRLPVLGPAIPALTVAHVAAEASACSWRAGPRVLLDEAVSRVRQDVRERDGVRHGRYQAVTLLTRHTLAPIMAALCQTTWVRLKHRIRPRGCLLVFAKEWGPD